MGIGVQVVFDCADPAEMTRFWSVALGYVEQPPPEGFASWDAFLEAIGVRAEERGSKGAIVDPDGAGPRVFFQKVPEGKVVKNRVHLDVNAGAGAPDDAARAAAVDAHLERCVAAGATVLRREDSDLGRWVVLTDPEGNEFCVQ
ncbi:MAG: VOC family protein [Motilibacteraceae bacterium]